jgi:hypothetical protein
MTAQGAAVLLIDIENMIGINARPATLATKVDALIGQAGPGIQVVAACAGSRITPASVKALKDRKVALLTVDGSKDAADQALLSEAGRLAAQGCTRFVIASNDNRFGQVADLGQLEIIIWASQKPAPKYASRAAAVHRLPRPGASAPSAKPSLPAPAYGTGPTTANAVSTKVPPPAAGSPEPPAQHPPAQPPPAQHPPARHPVATASLAALAAATLTAGVLFGAGTVLGAAAALRILGRQLPDPARRG